MEQMFDKCQKYTIEYSNASRLKKGYFPHVKKIPSRPIQLSS